MLHYIHQEACLYLCTFAGGGLRTLPHLEARRSRAGLSSFFDVETFPRLGTALPKRNIRRAALKGNALRSGGRRPSEVGCRILGRALNAFVSGRRRACRASLSSAVVLFSWTPRQSPQVLPYSCAAALE